MTGRISAILVDLDGTVYSGSEPIPGAARFIAELERRDIAYLFVTNRANRGPQVVADHLVELGIPCRAESILTSAQATAVRLGKGRAYCLGESGLTDALAAAGIEVVEQDPDVVVVSYDRALTYEKLERAVRFLAAGAGFVATNPDPVIITESGLSPETGSILAAVEAASGRKAEIVGKPQRPIIDAAVQRLGRPRGETVILGDNLDTDILAGQNAGLRCALILTGISTRAEAEACDRPPDWIAEDYDELTRLLLPD